MAVQILYRAQAFGPGSDLWVIPAEENHPVLKKMDWYLNFQLTSAHMHVDQELAPQLKVIMGENNLPSFHNPTPHKKPLMIAAELHFPAKSIVELPKQSSKEKWMEQLHNLWARLNRPALRVFLPANMTADDFKTAWPGNKSEDVTVVPS